MWLPNRYVMCSLSHNKPSLQTAQDNYFIPHNTPFRRKMYTFLFWMVHCGIWCRCIVGCIGLVCCTAHICPLGVKPVDFTNPCVILCVVAVLTTPPASSFVGLEGVITSRAHIVICKTPIYARLRPLILVWDEIGNSSSIVMHKGWRMTDI